MLSLAQLSPSLFGFALKHISSFLVGWHDAIIRVNYAGQPLGEENFIQKRSPNLFANLDDNLAWKLALAEHRYALRG